jgi:hypothetical protein
LPVIDKDTLPPKPQKQSITSVSKFHSYTSIADKLAPIRTELYEIDLSNQSRKGTSLEADLKFFDQQQRNIRKEAFELLNKDELHRRSQMTLLQRNIE